MIHHFLTKKFQANGTKENQVSFLKKGDTDESAAQADAVSAGRVGAVYQRRNCLLPNKRL